MDAIMQRVSDMRSQGLNTKTISKHLGISEYKTVKILATLGDHTETGAQINRMLDSGMSQEEVAAALGLAPRSILRYIPYTRGVYNATIPTENALRVRACRDRKKEASLHEP